MRDQVGDRIPIPVTEEHARRRGDRRGDLLVDDRGSTARRDPRTEHQELAHRDVHAGSGESGRAAHDTHRRRPDPLDLCRRLPLDEQVGEPVVERAVIPIGRPDHLRDERAARRDVDDLSELFGEPPTGVVEHPGVEDALGLAAELVEPDGPHVVVVVQLVPEAVLRTGNVARRGRLEPAPGEHR